MENSLQTESIFSIAMALHINSWSGKVQQILLLSPNIPFTSPYSAIKIWFKIHPKYISSFHHSGKLQKIFYCCMHGQASWLAIFISKLSLMVLLDSMVIRKFHQKRKLLCNWIVNLATGWCTNMRLDCVETSPQSLWLCNPITHRVTAFSQ